MEAGLWEHSEILDDEVIKEVSDALGINPDLIRNKTREGIINILKVEKVDGILYQQDNGTHTTNNNPLDKVSELYERLREKDNEVYQKEKELIKYEYKIKCLQEKNEKLRKATK